MDSASKQVLQDRDRYARSEAFESEVERLQEIFNTQSYSPDEQQKLLDAAASVGFVLSHLHDRTASAVEIYHYMSEAPDGVMAAFEGRDLLEVARSYPEESNWRDVFCLNVLMAAPN
jgi:hypothetical protein